MLLVNGRMVGVWRQMRRDRRMVREIEPFGRLPAWARTQAEAKEACLTEFLAPELELSWTTAS